jgi:hypothetical protein
MPVVIVGSGGVPIGTYTATFQGIEAQPEDKDRGYGPGTRWKFQIEAGPHRGQTASRITRTTPSPRNTCGKMLSGLLGRALQEGEEIDLDQCIGQRYMIVVGAGPMGGARVEAVAPMSPS